LSSWFLSRNTNIKAYIIITFSGVWYGFETWSTTSKHSLMMFEDRVLRIIFGSKKEAGKKCSQEKGNKWA
jgi:hypothetical protein